MTLANTANTAAREIVFVDSRVQDSATLLQGISSTAEVVYLRAGEDGLKQMAAALGERGDVGAVHILAHGNAGQLWLGSTFLDPSTLAAQADALAAIGRGLATGGDLLVYACDLASGDAGAQFVARLADLTGADVAASNNRTGVNSDWNLEITTGSIESANVLSANAMSEYQWGLATWTATNNFNSGVGSLRAALTSAQNGDIVTFNASMTVALTSALVIDKNITIDGDLNNDNVADVTLDGQYRTQTLNVTAGTTATLDGLVITRGMVSGNGGNGGNDALVSQGGGIYNAGTLTVKNVTVTANAASGGGGGGGVTPQYAGGGGGGGGAITGGTGGKGGDTLNATGSNGSAGQGGAGGGFFNMGGRGGSATGGAGGSAYPGYSTGSAGGTASSGGLSIGGGGGGDGYNDIGGAGGGAVGGIYNDTGATLRIIGNSVISNNVGAGGGGGGGGAGGGYNHTGGAGGVGVGAIWNKGSILITAANFAALAGNVGGSGVGGTSAGTAGVSPASVANVYGNGGTINTNYVPDETPPTATVVVANTNLNSGGTSTATITFSEAVTGLTAADLTVQNGTIGTLTSGDGGITWTGTLTAASNIADTTNIITLNNTGVADLAGNAGVGTTDSNNYIVNDTVAPTASIVVANTALRIGETSLVTITFSEAVSGFTTADLTVANGTLSGLSTSDGGITWTATLTPDAAITDTSNLVALNNTGIVDLNGNAGSGTTNSNNYAIDTVRPTATIVVTNTALKIGDTSLVTITFSEAVTGFTLADLTVANGSLSGLSTSDNIIYAATFTPTAGIADTTNLITLANTGVADGAGNVGTGTTDSNNYAIDTVRPTATIVVADSSLTAGETSLVTIAFSEAVSGFSNADLSIANGMLSAVSSSDGGVTWTATFTPTDGVLDATNLITLANTGVADLAGNAGSGTTNSNNYAISTVLPTATIVVADNALTIGETSLVTIAFSEAISGFSNADLTIANGTLSAVSSSDGGITWTATLTPTASITDATNVIALDRSGVQNAAGNAGVGTSNSNNYAIDTVRPTATIVAANTALGIGQTTLVTITFAEAVSGFTNADLTIANGTLSAVSSSDGGITWTATLTPAAGIMNAVNVIALDNTGVTDLAGNAGTGTTNSNNYAIDALRPTATIAVADAALKAGAASLVTITFSEAVTGFTNTDLAVDNGTLSAVSSSDGGITWTTTLTPTAGITNANNAITLTNAGVSDVAGNAGTGTTSSNNYAIDTAPPAVSSVAVPSNATYTAGQHLDFTVNWSEAVTVDTTAGNPRLAVTLDSGGTAYAAYQAGSGTSALTFRLTVTAGQIDLTGIALAASLDLHGATLRDAAGNNATLALNGVPVTSGVLVNAPAPDPGPGPVVPPPSSDGDNIPNAVEDTAPGLAPAGGGAAVAGDGNGDGIADSKQAAVTSVSFLNTPTAQSNPSSAAPVYVTLVAGSTEGKTDTTDTHGPTLNNVQQLDAPANLPAGITMPMGLISFTANVQSAGALETFSLYVDPALSVNGYWKTNAAGTWVNLASAAHGGKTVLEGGKLRLDFNLTDGGEFDADGKADGVITDPGAAAFLPLSIVGYTPAPPESGFWF